MSACDNVARIGPFNDGNIIKFMGATVRSVQSTIGWNGGTSQVNIDVVEDCNDAFSGRAGNDIDSDAIGTPRDIQVGNFYFAGIVQSIIKTEDFNGFPAYQVVLLSPIGLLEGTQLIIGAYNGTIKFSGRRIPNLLNIFGYLEAGVFGFSGTNDGGCYWQYSSALGVKPAVEAITGYSAIPAGYSNTDETYGGALEWKGYTYKVNLSNMPYFGAPESQSAPQYYRIPNQAVSLLEAISQVCTDGGFEFFVNLTLLKDDDGNILGGPHEISIETISRREQPSLGEVNLFIENNTKYRNSSSQGMEFRDGYVSAFLLGSMVEELTIISDTDKIKQFWGYTEESIPIFGEDDERNFTVIDSEGNESNVSLQFQRMTLNATSISDVIDSTTYICTTAELQCALGSMESWLQFKKAMNDTSYDEAVTGTFPIFLNDIDELYDLAARIYKDYYDRKKTKDENKILPFDAVDEDKIKEKIQKLYEFVRGVASEYYGKKFLVALNNVSIRIDSDTNERQYSHSIIQSAYIGDGGRPLDITTTNAVLFMDQTNRFGAMARTVVQPNQFYFSLSNPDSSVAEQSSTNINIFHKLNVSDYFIDYEVFGNKLWVEVSIDDYPFQAPTNPWGDLNLLAILTKLNPENIDDLIGSEESYKLLVQPRPIYPEAFAIPTRNNTVVYGPWGQFPDDGVTGRCYLEIDDSLNPWTYEIGLNTVAQQKIQNVVTNLQVVENGVIQVAGTPDKSLGESLVDEGNLYLTGVDINYEIQGVTTTYKIQTYTPRFGVFSFGNAERLRRVSDASAKQRRALREQIRQKKQTDISSRIAMTPKMWHETMEAFHMASPKSVLVSQLIEDKEEEGTFYSTVSLSTAKEALALLPKDDEKYKKFAVASLDSVFAPIRIGECEDDESPGNAIIPCESMWDYFDKRRLSIWGNPKVSDRQTDRAFYRNQTPEQKLPGYTVGLRSPMLLSGWAQSVFKKDTCLPNEDEDVESLSIANANGCDTAFIRNESHSKSGPFEIFWDHKRKVFCAPGFVLIGRVTQSSPSIKVELTVDGEEIEDDEIAIVSPLGSVEVDQTVAMMRGIDGNWNIIAASCS